MVVVGDGPSLTLTADLGDAASGYSASVLAAPAGRRAGLFSIEFDRAEGVATQSHTYDFVVPRFTCTKKLTRCAVRSQRAFGDHGRAALAFVPSGRARRVAPPASCAGRVVERRGKLVGSLAFDPHNAALPKRSGRLSVAAKLTFSSLECDDGDQGPCHVTAFVGIGSEAAASSRGLAFLRPDFGDSLALAFFAQETGGGRGAEIHTLSYSRLAPGALSFAPDLSRATFDSTSLPFLSGSLTYTASAPLTPEPSPCGEVTGTQGSAIGDLTAHFDGMPPTPLAAPDAALYRVP